MSRIYFHSQHGTSEVRGSERAMAGGLCTDLLRVALRLNDRFMCPDDAARYLTLFPAGHYIHGLTRDERLRASIDTAVSVGDEFFTAALNTALDIGSDPVKLMARLHGQCEIHAYVEGPNRAWLADIIDGGRRIGVLRANMGWESVVTLLQSRDDGPVVTSYSVTEQFPNPGVADFHAPETDDEDADEYEAWEALPVEERWSLALAGIRSERGLELKPDVWNDFYFGDGTNGYDLLADVLVSPSTPRERPE